MNTPADRTPQGLTILLSRHSVVETLDRLESSLKARGVLIFARIDFTADAAKVGLSLRPEQLLLFGSPKGGTPLMLDQACIGIDLPFKALAFEDAAGSVSLAYNEPSYLMARHGLDATLAKNLAPLVTLIEQAAA
jgi:uncharacterized protein (DUF302 family)